MSGNELSQAQASPIDVELASDTGIEMDYTYERADGTVEHARSAEEVFEKCPVLGRLAIEAPEQANILLELAAVGNQILKTQEQPKPVEVIDDKQVEQTEVLAASESQSRDSEKYYQDTAKQIEVILHEEDEPETVSSEPATNEVIYEQEIAQIVDDEKPTEIVVDLGHVVDEVATEQVQEQLIATETTEIKSDEYSVEPELPTDLQEIPEVYEPTEIVASPRTDIEPELALEQVDITETEDTSEQDISAIEIDLTDEPETYEDYELPGSTIEQQSLETVKEQIDTRPLSETFQQLELVLPELKSDINQSKVIDLVQNIASQLELVVDIELVDTIELSDELRASVIELLEFLGSEEPEKLLNEFIETRGAVELVRVLQELSQKLTEDDGHEFLTSQLTSRAVKNDSRLYVGKMIFGLISSFSLEMKTL